jgi:hypothetical protein
LACGGRRRGENEFLAANEAFSGVCIVSHPIHRLIKTVASITKGIFLQVGFKPQAGAENKQARRTSRHGER